MAAGRPAPTKLNLETSAGLPTAAGTAWQALFESAHLEPGQTVLVHAGAGGVGSFAVQLAKYIGAHVVSTASAANADLVRSLGADQVIDYRTEDFSLRFVIWMSCWTLSVAKPNLSHITFLSRVGLSYRS